MKKLLNLLVALITVVSVSAYAAKPMCKGKPSVKEDCLEYVTCPAYTPDGVELVPPYVPYYITTGDPVIDDFMDSSGLEESPFQGYYTKRVESDSFTFNYDPTDADGAGYPDKPACFQRVWQSHLFDEPEGEYIVVYGYYWNSVFKDIAGNTNPVHANSYQLEQRLAGWGSWEAEVRPNGGHFCSLSDDNYCVLYDALVIKRTD